MLAQPEMYEEKGDEAHGDGRSQVSLSKASWLTQQWERETGLHPRTEAILNCYVHVNTDTLTLSPFTNNSVLPKDLTFNSSYVSGAQQCLLLGLEVKETFRWNVPEAGEHSVQFPCRILSKRRFCAI